MSDIEDFENIDKEITFKFESKEDALAFKHWFCSRAEQYLWNDTERQGEDQIVFNYHTGDSTIIVNKENYEK